MKVGLEPVHSGKNASQELEQIKSLWLEVCRSRGTQRPDPAEVASFLGALPESARSEGETSTLRLASQAPASTTR